VAVDLQLGQFGNLDTLLFLFAVIALAALTKQVRRSVARGRSLGPRGASFVAVEMVPHGEVGIIVAGHWRASGVIDDELFAVIVGMSVATTLVVLRPLASQTPQAKVPDT
jgi:Kef-type K+ transport system membrane component KefB